MKRFIRYLYEYEQGKRLRNVGFVKVEQSGEECVVHIHGKGLRMGVHSQLELYLFYEEGTKCIGIWQGTVEHVNPAINYQLYYTKDDAGMEEHYDQIRGIILTDGMEHKFAAVWDDMPVNVDQMSVWEPKPKEEGQTEMESGQDMEPEQDTEQAMEYVPEPTEEPASESTTESASEPQEMQLKTRKINRQALAELPRCEWKLANNSFLLHGYYNYHHLLLIQDESGCRLGVPGIYHPKEEKAAAAFGFPQFVKADELQVDIEEQAEQEVFGYWCRSVKCKMS